MRPHSALNWGDYATGAARHEPHPADRRMEEHFPGAAPIPDAFSMADRVARIYNQGKIPCCVTASVAVMMGVQDAVDRGAWRDYEFLEAYHAVGGDDHQPVAARRVMQYAEDCGFRVTATMTKHRIASYAVAPQDPESFVATIKAALAAEHPCVLACRLPAQFGWDSGGPATEAYHQFCLVGYEPDDVILANTWSALWGNRGFGRIPWSFLTADGLQHGDCYSYTALDLIT